jgi:hypothetical protein
MSLHLLLPGILDVVAHPRKKLGVDQGRFLVQYWCIWHLQKLPQRIECLDDSVLDHRTDVLGYKAEEQSQDEEFGPAQQSINAVEAGEIVEPCDLEAAPEPTLGDVVQEKSRSEDPAFVIVRSGRHGDGY